MGKGTSIKAAPLCTVYTITRAKLSCPYYCTKVTNGPRQDNPTAQRYR